MGAFDWVSDAADWVYDNTVEPIVDAFEEGDPLAIAGTVAGTYLGANGIIPYGAIGGAAQGASTGANVDEIDPSNPGTYVGAGLGMTYGNSIGGGAGAMGGSGPAIMTVPAWGTAGAEGGNGAGPLANVGAFPYVSSVFGGDEDGDGVADDRNTEAANYLENYINTPEEIIPQYGYEYMTPDTYLDPYSSGRAYTYADQESINAQYDALDQLQEWGTGDLTDTDMLNLRQAQNQNAMAERGARDATMNQMQARGMGGSGAELAALLGGQQTMANSNSAEAMSMQVAAQDRALRATEGAGNLSSNIRGSSFQEAYDRGSAWDEFNTSNVGYARDLQQRNVATENQQGDVVADANQDIYGQHQDVASLAAGYPPPEPESNEASTEDRLWGAATMLGQTYIANS